MSLLEYYPGYGSLRQFRHLRPLQQLCHIKDAEIAVNAELAVNVEDIEDAEISIILDDCSHWMTSPADN